MAPHFRLDIPYVPHITLGTLDDHRQAKRLCDDLNRQGVSIEGLVDAIAVGTFEGGRIEDIASCRLRA